MAAVCKFVFMHSCVCVSVCPCVLFVYLCVLTGMCVLCGNVKKEVFIVEVCVCVCVGISGSS